MSVRQKGTCIKSNDIGTIWRNFTVAKIGHNKSKMARTWLQRLISIHGICLKMDWCCCHFHTIFHLCSILLLSLVLSKVNAWTWTLIVRSFACLPNASFCNISCHLTSVGTNETTPLFFPKESFSGAAAAAWKKSNKVNEGPISDFADTAKGSRRIYFVYHLCMLNSSGSGNCANELFSDVKALTCLDDSSRRDQQHAKGCWLNS